MSEQKSMCPVCGSTQQQTVRTGRDVKGFVVSLEQDISAEQAERIETAFRLLDGVIDIMPIQLVSADWLIESRVKSEMYQRIRELFFPLYPRRG